MARKSYAEQQIPATDTESVPYATRREMANGFLGHIAEKFVGEVTGAGGVGGELTGIPFEPAIVDLYDVSVPLMQRQIPGSSAAIDVNLIDGTAAANALVVAVDDASVPSWKVTLDVNLAPNAAVVSVVCTGVRQVRGSL